MTTAYIVDAVRTPVGRRGGSLASVHSADLGAVTLEPTDRVAERIGCGYLLEAEQSPELDRALDLAGRYLQRDVMEHAASISDARA